MNRMSVRRLALLGAVAVAATLGAARAEEPQKFDLEVQLGLNSEFTSSLKEGDVLQVVLRPEVQFGQRSSAGEPIVLEKKFEPGMPAQTITFKKALTPDQIYRLEMQLVRASDPKHPERVRYISALDKLPRRPVEKSIKMRLFLGDKRDTRDNHVMVVKDADGVYRVMVFTA